MPATQASLKEAEKSRDAAVAEQNKTLAKIASQDQASKDNQQALAKRISDIRAGGGSASEKDSLVQLAQQDAKNQQKAIEQAKAQLATTLEQQSSKTKAASDEVARQNDELYGPVASKDRIGTALPPSPEVRGTSCPQCRDIVQLAVDLKRTYDQTERDYDSVLDSIKDALERIKKIKDGPAELEALRKMIRDMANALSQGKSIVADPTSPSGVSTVKEKVLEYKHQLADATRKLSNATADIEKDTKRVEDLNKLADKLYASATKARNQVVRLMSTSLPSCEAANCSVPQAVQNKNSDTTTLKGSTPQTQSSVTEPTVSRPPTIESPANPLVDQIQQATAEATARLAAIQAQVAADLATTNPLLPPASETTPTTSAPTNIPAPEPANTGAASGIPTLSPTGTLGSGLAQTANKTDSSNLKFTIP